MSSGFSRLLRKELGPKGPGAGAETRRPRFLFKGVYSKNNGPSCP
jgi:hypothetical protein